MYVLTTVDTENLQTPFWNGLYDESALDLHLDGEAWCTTRLAKIFAEYGLTGVFFLAVNEADHLGDAPLQLLVQNLLEEGQEVQVHSHPIWSDTHNPPREFMHEYKLEEQTALLKEMKTRLEEWGVGDVLAHRGGAYGINEETIEALKQIGIGIDSSMYFGHPNCQVQWSVNCIAEKEGMVEIPVTGFIRETRIGWKSFSIPIKRKFVKTDLDACSLDELKHFVEEGRKNGLKVMDFFMHSYSLVHFDKTEKVFTPNAEKEQRLRAFLEYLQSDEAVQLIDIETFAGIYESTPEQLQGPDYVPVYRHCISPMEFLGKLWKKRFKTR